MRLISSVLLVFFFSPAFSTLLESGSKNEQGEATTTSAPVIPDKSKWRMGFLPPRSDSGASTTSATSIAASQKSNENQEAPPSTGAPEPEWEKGFLPPLSVASTTSTPSTAAPEILSNDVPHKVKHISTKLKTNSTKVNKESTSAENANERESEDSSTYPQHAKSKKHHHKAKPTEPPLPMTVTPLTDHPTRHSPCRCDSGKCACCTGAFLESLHIPVHRRACVNIEYKPDDFDFRFKIFWNDQLLFNQVMSAKNPEPACIPINRYFGVKLCAKLSNVYIIERNMHACLDLQGTWNDNVAFDYPFNCFRIGNKGVTTLKPEDGGGLPPPPDEEEQVDEDYDDSAKGWKNKVDVFNI